MRILHVIPSIDPAYADPSKELDSSAISIIQVDIRLKLLPWTHLTP